MNNKWPGLRLIILLSLSACIGVPTRILPTLTNLPIRTATAIPPTATAMIPSLTSSVTADAIRTVTSTPASLPTPTVAPSAILIPTNVPAPLSKTGPWLMMNWQQEKDLSFFNLDGSGQTQLTTFDNLYLIYPNLINSFIPGGHWIALEGMAEPANLIGRYLDLVHLPDFKVIRVSRLDSDWPDFQTARDSGVYAAVGWTLWSPDGKYLAFTAALDGNQYADLYLAQTAQPGLIRLTSAHFNARPLAWTPDSRQILYSESASCNSDIGICPQASSVWIASPDGQAHKIYTAKPGQSDTIAGLTFGNQMLVFGNTDYLPSSLRWINYSTGQTTMVRAGEMASVAVDPDTGAIAFTLNVPQSSENGVYLIENLGGKPVLVKAGGWDFVRWEPEINQFLVGGSTQDGTLLVSPEGNITEFMDENWYSQFSLPAVSPDGKLIAFDQTGIEFHWGLRVYRLPGAALAQNVTQDPVNGVTWQPDSKGLFYFTGGTMTHLDIASGISIPVAKVCECMAGEMIWIK